MSLKMLTQIGDMQRQIALLEARLIERDNVLADINKAIAELQAKRVGRPPKDKNGLGTSETINPAE